MMWNASLGMDQEFGKPMVPPFRNRRKARSLITQAQEAQQRKQQNLRWAQKVHTMQQCLEPQPQLAEQQQQLEQHLKTWLGMMPDGQQEAQAPIRMEERSCSPEMQQQPNSQPQGLLAGPACATKSDSETPANQTTGKAQFCPYCGGKVMQRFKFCRYCGEDVSHLREL